VRAALSLALVLLLGGCAVSLPAVRGHHDTLRERIHRAKALGAMECAPGELAAAQVQYRFASLELSQGDLSRADQHIQAGLDQADLAISAGVACPSEGVTVKDLLADPWPDADGDAVTGEDEKCPWEIEDRDGYLDHDGCPEPDNDGDGIPDRQDQCPNEAEDLDGYGDEDGCPEHDNDGDGIPDEVDACRDVAETINGFSDEDGCPDFRPEHLDLFEDRVVFRKPLIFVDKGYAVLGISHPPLRELAKILQDNDEVTILIRGHTHNRGAPEELTALSEGRAGSVRDFLVLQGIETSRIAVQGVGPDEPVATNRTASGRKENERIEVQITGGVIQTVSGQL